MTAWLPLVLIALAVLLASLRLCLPPRPPRARLSLQLALQLAAALLLGLTLFPPRQPVPADTLLIASAGTTAAALASTPAGMRLRLPEAPALADVGRVPDLATALRRHPGTRELVVVGQGLPARDRDAALPPLRFLPAPAPRGLVELQAPAPLAAGARFEVGTRVQGLARARVELLDPAGHRVAIGVPGGDGRVRLAASARDAGDVEFTLRALDRDGKVLDQLPVPVRVRPLPAPTLRLLAGAPGPELKYLQRWATDAGADVQTGIDVGGGVQLGDAPPAIDPASLARLDLLLLDERRLAALSVAQRAAITAAMRDGLGVLVRMGGALDGNARRTLRDWGLDLRGGERTATVKLRDAGADMGAGTGADAGTGGERAPAAPAIERFDLAFADPGVVPLLRAADDNAIGGWRAFGRGRIGLLPIADSYTLVLAGHADIHAELWNQVLAVLARPLPASPLARLPAWAWAGERVALCGLPDGARVQAPDGDTTALLADPRAGNCSGWWPRQAGWHRVVVGDASAGVRVIDPAAARALHAQATREATAALRGGSGPAGTRALPVPGPRWPWLLGFIGVAGLLWWLERRTRPAT